MNDLMVKNVEFCGAELLAVKEKETGKVYAGINSVLRELGFDESQIRYRRERWLNDRVLCKGVRKFLHPSLIGGNQETYCIDINKLPLALAKLEITPKIERELPELSYKLEEYQDKCADVLAEAFLPQTTISHQYPLPAATFDGAANLGRLIERVMRNEGSCPHEIAMVLKPIFQQAGLEIRDCFIKKPAYEQYTLDIVVR